MSNDKPIWERLPAETEEAWLAFKQYRDLVPPRSVRRVGVATSRDASKWYSEHNWKERAEALDQMFDKIYIEERKAILAQSAKDIAAEHMSLLSDARDIISKELSRLRASMGEIGGPGMRVAELIKFTDLVIRMDRLVRGEATENTKSTMDLSGMSDEELERYAELNAKATEL